MRKAIQVLVKEKVISFQDLVNYFQTSESVIRMDLDYLGLKEEDFPLKSDTDIVDFLIRKRNQIYYQVSQLPSEQHAEECAKYGFSFPEPIYNAFKDNGYFQIVLKEYGPEKMFEQLFQPIPETELIQNLLCKKQFRLEKLRYDATLMYMNGCTTKEIGKRTGYSIDKIQKCLNQTAKQAGVDTITQFMYEVKSSSIEDLILRGATCKKIQDEGFNYHRLNHLQQRMGIQNGKELCTIKREDNCDRIVYLYNTGMTQQEVADLLKVDRQTIQNRLKEYYKKHPEKYDWNNFKKMRHTGIQKKEQQQQLDENVQILYENGFSISKMMKYLNVNSKGIYDSLNRLNVRYRQTTNALNSLIDRRGLTWVTTILHEERQHFEGVIHGYATTDLRLMTGEKSMTISNDIGILRDAVRYFGGREELEAYVKANPKEAKEKLKDTKSLIEFLQSVANEKISHLNQELEDNLRESE